MPAGEAHRPLASRDRGAYQAAMLRAFAALAALLTFATAQDPPRPTAEVPGDRLLVVNKADDSLSIFAPDERRELATVPTGHAPHEVAVSPDGTLAVVTDYGDQKPGQTLTVVDVFAAKVVRTIDLTSAIDDAERRQRSFLRPHGVRFVDDKHVVVTSESTRRLLLVDIERGAIERTWSTPQTTMHMVALSPDGKLAWASSIKDGNVVPFGLAADGVAGGPPIACEAGSEGIAVHPRSGEVWVGNRSANSVSIVDAAKRAVVKTLPTGELPFRIAFTPDGAHGLVSCAEAGTVMVFDAAKHELRAEISIHEDRSELSAMPMGLTTDPEGKRIYTTCGRGEFVAVLDREGAHFVERIPARKGCDGIAYARRVVAPGRGGLRR